jgi:indole-3-glycerol phosphate synthase
MNNHLQKIIADKQQHVAARKEALPLAELEQQLDAQTPPRGFIRALWNKQKAGHYGLIAEIKRASPSKGLIRADFDPPSLAGAYEKGGAACLSVLTDRPYFQGGDTFLVAARNEVALPVLRKDFMIDPYQIIESRALGADCILLIMAALDDSLARELYGLATGLQMDVLVEVHDLPELERALALNPAMIGINNRNLQTFEVRLETAIELVRHLPSACLPVAESGLSKPADLAKLAGHGITAFLIGESLMRQNNVETATRTLLDRQKELK